MMPSGAHNTGGMAIPGTATIGIGVGAADGSAGGIAAAASAAGVDGKGRIAQGRSRRDVPLPQFVPFQLSQPVEKPPSGPQWVHEIKLDGYRMAARIDNGRTQLLTRTGLDWTAK